MKQALEDVGIGIDLSVPDRLTSPNRLYTSYDFDLAISNRASRSEPVPSTTLFFAADGIVKGAPFRDASGYPNHDVDAVVGRLKVETDPAAHQVLVAEFKWIMTFDAVLSSLVEVETIAVAGTRESHSKGPDFAATAWSDLWLSG